MKSSTSLAAFVAPLCAAALLGATPAAAQLATHSDAPVDITADELEVVNASCQAIWRGNAEALQDTTRLRANVLKIFSTPGPAKPGATTPNCGAMERMEADGAVYYMTPQQRVRGDAGTYDAVNSILVMTGDVVAVQGQNVMRGQRMTINTRTGEAHMQGSSTGRNTKGRPRGVFYPKSDTAGSGASKSDTGAK
jgi:lipopolysaccharide export system protein LptA